MAIVVPFKGVFYNLEKIGDFSKVTAPPYDIISPEQQEDPQYQLDQSCNPITCHYSVIQTRPGPRL